MSLQPGSVLHDRYRIEGQLGEGGMGAVYLAVDERLKIQVAVKENLNPGSERQFLREASLLASLRHPNLPRVTDHFILEGHQYLVMDYVEGEELRVRCARQQPSVAEVLTWAISICDALAYLHSRQPPVIHRDIKPSNLKVQADGSIVLVDFGIAKVVDQAPTTMGARGLTPGFSPPEQYGGTRTDARSDQYSLAATLYALLTGCQPEDSIERMFNKAQLKPVREINPSVPAHVDEAIRRAMSLEPDDRFPDITAFRGALRATPEAATIQVERPTAVPAQPPSERSMHGRASGGEESEAQMMAGNLTHANPFTFGNPIRDPARFHGRSQEIRQITNRLLSSAHESTSLVGERRIGKTSLLTYLSHPDVAPRLGLAPDRFCLVYLDFQGLTDITPLRFWQRVLAKMARSACNPDLAARFKDLAAQSEFDLFDLEDLFEEVASHNLNVVLFLDEFEYVTQNPNFGGDFFGGLRALAIHHALALVPATRRELVDLCHSDEIKGSPFFNIFANVVLRRFPPADAQALLQAYTASAGISLPPDEQNLILRLGGGHPLFLQMAGHYLVEDKLQGLAGPALLTRLQTDFEHQAQAHFSDLWAHCSEGEKITLLAILALSRQKPTKKSLPNLENLTRLHPRARPDSTSLANRGLLDETDGVYSLFSPSFENWVALELSAEPGQEEAADSVQTWLQESGWDTIDPIKGILPRFKKKYWPILGELLKDLSFKMIAVAAAERLI
jgi:serine/threonine protein kinase